MKKVCLSLIVLLAFVLQFCSSSKKSVSKKPANITYVANIQPIMVNSCSPCHMPPQGNKKPYNTYAAVKGDINEIISRIQRNPTDKGFMPQRHPKLSDSTINIFVQWRNTGMLEN